uniref:Uncharacterized protein n=1 Tax=Panagrolaimus sp. ES5 TaxID=591445 RepID=A0AC34FIY7_9BILA
MFKDHFESQIDANYASQITLKNIDTLTRALYSLANLILDEYIITADGIPEIFQNGFDPKTEKVQFLQLFHDHAVKTVSTSKEKANHILPGELFEKVFEAYLRIAGSTSESARIVQLKYAVAQGRYGTALIQIKKIIADKPLETDYFSAEKAIVQVSFASYMA